MPYFWVYVYELVFKPIALPSRTVHIQTVPVMKFIVQPSRSFHMHKLPASKLIAQPSRTFHVRELPVAVSVPTSRHGDDADCVERRVAVA